VLVILSLEDRVWQMNKSELVAKVAKETGVSKEVAQKAVEAFAKALVVSAKDSQTVDMAGLGKIHVVKGHGGVPRSSASKAASISLTPSNSLKMRVNRSRKAKAAAAAMSKAKAQII
jgi:nucleoid DNA-binding protein